MICTIKYNEREISADLSKPLDISIPLRKGDKNVNAWYVDPVKIEPVMTDQFTGSVKSGGVVNFNNISFNPHGNGTHTECVGHISEKVHSVNKALKEFFFLAELISVEPEIWQSEEEWRKPGDKVITAGQIKESLQNKHPESLIIRSRPNSREKINFHYSNSNPPYITHEAMELIVASGVKHLLIDLPSVDREMDGGKMLAHRSFWKYPAHTRHNCTITEMVFIDDSIEDGEYLLNLQIASFENDASPSKPVLYKIY